MARIFGMSAGTFVLRLLGAIISAGISIVLFLLIPRLVSSALPPGIFGFSENQIVFYGVVIGVLSGLQIIFRDRWLGDAASIGNGIVQIYYLYVITNGGVLSFVTGSTSVAINFAAFLYLLMLPSAFSVVSGVFRLLTRSSLQKFQDAEEIILR
jgi:hypothetical protein